MVHVLLVCLLLFAIGGLWITWPRPGPPDISVGFTP
jgi:hypothetical protein